MFTVVDLVQSRRMRNHLTIHVHAYDQTLGLKRCVWNFFEENNRFVAFVIVCGCICFVMGCQLSHSNANNWAQISYGAFSVLDQYEKKIEQEKKSNIWTWDPFGPYLRGVWEHTRLWISLGRLFEGISTTQTDKVFGCECWSFTLRDMQLTINEHKLFQTCNAQRWPTKTKQP